MLPALAWDKKESKYTLRGQGRKIKKEGTSWKNTEVTAVCNRHWLTRASPGAVAINSETFW